MHLYMAGMPLELVSQWLGHSQLRHLLIYARATTDMKRKAVDKISAKENSVFRSDEKFKYADNEDVIRQAFIGLHGFKMPIFILNSSFVSGTSK